MVATAAVKINPPFPLRRNAVISVVSPSNGTPTMTINHGAMSSNGKSQYLVSVPSNTAARYTGTIATMSISARQTLQCVHVNEVRVHRYSIVPGSISLPEAVAPRNTAERKLLGHSTLRIMVLTKCAIKKGLYMYSLRSKCHHPFCSLRPGVSVTSRAGAVDSIKRKMKLARVSRQHFQAYMHPPCEPGAETIPASRSGKSLESPRLGCAGPRQSARLRAQLQSGGSGRRLSRRRHPSTAQLAGLRRKRSPDEIPAVSLPTATQEAAALLPGFRPSRKSVPLLPDGGSKQKSSAPG